MTMTKDLSPRSLLMAGVALLSALILGLGFPGPRPATGTANADATVGALAETRPNIFFYNLDDLRDAFPGAIDPLSFMPKMRAWMSDGRRYTQMFVADPSCCPSRAAMMTGRYPHNNGVQDQQDGPCSTARTRWPATCAPPATRRTSTASS